MEAVVRKMCGNRSHHHGSSSSSSNNNMRRRLCNEKEAAVEADCLRRRTRLPLRQVAVVVPVHRRSHTLQQRPSLSHLRGRVSTDGAPCRVLER